MRIFFILLLFCPLSLSAEVHQDFYYQRIVSLKPNITQILLQLGLQEQIVGVTRFCPVVKKAQVIADYNSIDVEAVLRLKPDLVLVSPENTQARQVEALQLQGVNVKSYSFNHYDEMTQAVFDLATLVGIPERGHEIMAPLEQRLEVLKNRFAVVTPKTFVVIVERRPLMVMGGHTFLSSLFERIGFKNVFGNNRVPYPIISEEEFARLQVNFVFELSHAQGPVSPDFFGRPVRSLKIEDFLAAPQAVSSLEKLLQP